MCSKKQRVRKPKKHAEDIGVSTAWKKKLLKGLFGDRQRNFY